MLHKIDNIPIKTSIEQALNNLHISDSEDIAMVSGLFEMAKKIAKPKALYREAYVEEVSGDKTRINGYDFRSAVVTMNLKNIHRVFAYVCTCGTEVDDWSHKEKDSIVSFWLDMIKQMFLHDAIAFLKDHIKRVFMFEKLSVINPGSGNLENWPISQQKPLFDLIGNVKSEIGVTLSGSFLMVPLKSTSGLIFPSETEFVNCALCSRENCKGRQVPFDIRLYNKAFQN